MRVEMQSFRDPKNNTAHNEDFFYKLHSAYDSGSKMIDARKLGIAVDRAGVLDTMHIPEVLSEKWVELLEAMRESLASVIKAS